MNESHWIKTSSNHVLLIIMIYLDLNILVTIWGSGPRWVDYVYQEFCSLDPSSRSDKSFICCPSLTYTGPRNYPTTLIPNNWTKNESTHQVQLGHACRSTKPTKPYLMGGMQRRMNKSDQSHTQPLKPTAGQSQRRWPTSHENILQSS